MIAKRLQSVDSSAIRNTFQYARQLEGPLDLSVGFPIENTPESIKEAAKQAIEDNYTRYTSANGTPELRQAIASKLCDVNNIESREETVSIVPGLTTGILIMYLAVLDPGDEVILADPYFPPYKSLANTIGAKAVTVSTYPDFRFTADKIKPYINKNTKLLVLNSPNNPTGAVYTKEELQGIAQLATDHGLTIVSDEVYEAFCYEGEHISIGSMYQNTLTLNSFSKSYAMTGFRVGYINGPLEIINAINELLQYAVFSSSSLGQKAALAALAEKPIDSRTYAQKRDFIKEELGQDFNMYGLEGAFFAFLPLPPNMTGTDFAKKALDANLLVLPGCSFSDVDTHLRISYGGTMETVKQGVSKIQSLLRS